MKVTKTHTQQFQNIRVKVPRLAPIRHKTARRPRVGFRIKSIQERGGLIFERVLHIKEHIFIEKKYLDISLQEYQKIA